MTKTCKNSAKFIVTTMVCAFAFGLAQTAFPAWLDGVKELKVGDRTFPVCPEEEWARAGFPLRRVPDDKNAAIEYINAINLYVKEPENLSDLYNYVLGNLWTDEAKALVPWLEQNAPAIAALREGARKDDCMFPLLKEPGVAMMNLLLPHLSTMRSLARLLTIQGKYFESQGKYREALDNYLLIARVGYQVSKEPILISGLVGVALDAISAKAIEEYILRHEVQTETLMWLLEKLQTAPSAAENYRIVISGEKAFGMSVVDDLFQNKLSLADLLGRKPSLRVALPARGMKLLGLKAIMKSDFRKYWNWMEEWNSLPDHIALRQENMRADEIIEELPAWSLAKLLVPAISRARIAFVRDKATRSMLRAEIALRIYRNQKGQYPESLAAMKGTVEDIPVDAFTNEPLRYKRTEDGFVVYSVNENLVDDGGEIGERKEDKDLVRRYPLPRREPFKGPGQ
ncbi:MAG: hypothetical protein Q8Q12_21470 [bacterium]|nr:hypothetical protein [bacterium]